MKSSGLSRNALCISVAAAMLAGCGGSQPPIGAPGAMPQGGALGIKAVGRLSNETIVYSFAGGDDGAEPSDAPTSIGGKLLGTTSIGGNGGCAALNGCGTIYEVSAPGKERILYAFKGASDGEAPNGPLIDVKRVLIGTTVYGGGSICKSGNAEGCGTLFEVDASGKERALYRFPGKAEGAMPVSALTPFKGSFYGEAAGGGMGKCRYASYRYRGCGLIFKWNSSQGFSIVYIFKGGHDGGTPQGGLIMLKGNFYGTTSAGGSHSCYFNYGCGTVFRVTPSGRETTLHAFTGDFKDGAVPTSGLVVVDGNLYGTTGSGGKYNCGLSYYLPCGTVFKVTPSGEKQTIYNFQGGTDGAFPNAVITVAGELYGTTRNGGGPCGCGTLFDVTTSGNENILYHFKGGTDAAVPYSGVIDIGGMLYGTTVFGGSHNEGTVYAIAL
jgi:uncharacterized repeat protein (TIGR03803 family)